MGFTLKRKNSHTSGANPFLLSRLLLRRNFANDILYLDDIWMTSVTIYLGKVVFVDCGIFWVFYLFIYLNNV